VDEGIPTKYISAVGAGVPVTYQQANENEGAHVEPGSEKPLLHDRRTLDKISLCNILTY